MNKVVFRPGVFDLMHDGHVNCILDAALQGDYLIVGVQDDRNVFEQKGVMPTVPLYDRMQVIKQFYCVDLVVSYRDSDISNLLKKVNAEVLCVDVGYGSMKAQQKTLTYCRQNKIKVHYTVRTEGISSSQLRTGVQRFWDNVKPDCTMLTTKFPIAQTKHELSIIKRYLKPLHRVLDLGCGAGRIAIPISDLVQSITAIDQSEGLINEFRKKITDRNIENINVQCIDVCRSALNVYDIIICSGLLSCLDDKQYNNIISKLKTSIMPNGKLIIRSSFGIERRIDVINQYSEQLDNFYTSYYRTKEQITYDLDSDFRLIATEYLYANQTDTVVAMLVYQKK